LTNFIPNSWFQIIPRKISSNNKFLQTKNIPIAKWKRHGTTTEN